MTTTATQLTILLARANSLASDLMLLKDTDQPDALYDAIEAAADSVSDAQAHMREAIPLAKAFEETTTGEVN